MSGQKRHHKGAVWGIYVNPDYRNSGAGEKLLQPVIDHAIGVVDLLMLSVVEGNLPAIALYENLWFRAYGIEPRALKIGTKYFSDALMIRDLD